LRATLRAEPSAGNSLSSCNSMEFDLLTLGKSETFSPLRAQQAYQIARWTG
jgi:hypothetical protein